ncbi:MAG: ABC transporter substrate-binding protein [Candidatus Cloacimonetes bacterium]|nr:ABC transporter substrate-binding protein [Candidatus Cloacimonadota bacterium]
MKKMLILMLMLISIIACTGRKIHHNKTEVVFWHAMGGPLGEALEMLVDDFNSSHQDIFIKAVSMGRYDALSQKLMASMQTGTHPDIAQVYESWTANFIEGGVLLPIDSFIDRDSTFGEDDMNDIYDVFIKSNTMKGRLYSFPFNKSVRVLYYNKDIFFQNNLDPNKPPVTWDDFRKYCRILTKDTNNDGNINQWGTTFAISAWQFENLLLQAGGEMMNEDMTTPLLNSEKGIEALNFLNDILNTDKTAYLSTGFDWQNDFLAGKVAMVEGSSVSMAYMRNTGINFPLGISAIPVYKTKRSIISGTNVAIFKSGKSEVEWAAWEFLKWFTDTEQTARWSEMTYYMPVRKSSFEHPILKKRMLSNPEIASVYEQLNFAAFEPTIPEWYFARKELEEFAIERVFRKTMSPKEALDQVNSALLKQLDNKKRGEK